MEAEMEDHRCRIAAVKTEDPRYGSLLRGVTIEIEDPRCCSLLRGIEIEVDDPRCRSLEIEVEDPRCKAMFMIWWLLGFRRISGPSRMVFAAGCGREKTWYESCAASWKW